MRTRKESLNAVRKHKETGLQKFQGEIIHTFVNFNSSVEGQDWWPHLARTSRAFRRAILLASGQPDKR